jgi:copper transport protein
MRLRFFDRRISRLLLLAMSLAILGTLFFPAVASAHVLSNGKLTGFYTGQFDAPTLFNLVMISLVEVGAVFWVGAQLWLNFVLQTSSEKHAVERGINEQAQARFEQHFSLPALIVILLANIGVLAGQALIPTGGDWSRAFSPASLLGLATSAHFGVFWLIGEGAIILAIVIAIYVRFSRETRAGASPARTLYDTLLPLLNLLIGLVLFIAITMTSYTASVSSDIITFTIVLDWLHLLAAALWIGGILYIAAIYLPMLKKQSLADEARSLATVLPYYTPLAITGVIITFVAVLFSMTLNQISLTRLTGSAYGRALLVEIVLLAGLLVCSVIQLFLFSPRVGKEYRKYAYTAKRFAPLESTTAVEVEAPQSAPAAQQPTTAERIVTTDRPEKSPGQITQQVRLREKRLTRKIHMLTSILRWEPALGVAVLLSVGLTSVFTGTLSVVPTTSQQQPAGKTQPYTTTVTTSDARFTALLEVNPNRFGTNVFTVTVTDKSTGQVDTKVGVTISMTMLDMDMGTDSISLLPDGKGHFSGSGDLSMAGNWQISIQIRAADHTLHEANANIVTAF